MVVAHKYLYHFGRLVFFKQVIYIFYKHLSRPRASATSSQSTSSTKLNLQRSPQQLLKQMKSSYSNTHSFLSTCIIFKTIHLEIQFLYICFRFKITHLSQDFILPEIDSDDSLVMNSEQDINESDLEDQIELENTDDLEELAETESDTPQEIPEITKNIEDLLFESQVD